MVVTNNARFSSAHSTDRLTPPTPESCANRTRESHKKNLAGRKTVRYITEDQGGTLLFSIRKNAPGPWGSFAQEPGLKASGKLTPVINEVSDGDWARNPTPLLSGVVRRFMSLRGGGEMLQQTSRFLSRGLSFIFIFFWLSVHESPVRYHTAGRTLTTLMLFFYVKMQMNE
jgi:hypothetical protein